MRRIIDLCAIILLLTFFLLGLFGAPVSDGTLVVILGLLIGGGSAVFWLVTRARSIWRDLWRGWRALQVAYTRLQFARQGGTNSEAIRAALQAGNWKNAARGLQHEARRGDALAHYRLSHLFRRGLGVPRSPEAQLCHLKQAAEKGIIAAQAELGAFYANKHHNAAGISDPWRARDWLEKAARKGHTHAALDLGSLYESGEFGRSRPDMAAHWYRYSAERDDPNGQYHLGRLYLEGKGVKQDAVQASVWLGLAAKRLKLESPLTARLARALHRAHSQLTDSLEAREAKNLVTAWNKRLTPPHSILTQTRRWAQRTRLSQLAEPLLERIRLEIAHLQGEIAAGLASSTTHGDTAANTAHAAISESSPSKSSAAVNPSSSQPTQKETPALKTPMFEADWLRNLKKSLLNNQNNAAPEDLPPVSPHLTQKALKQKTSRKTQPHKEVSELLKRARATKARLEKKRNPEKVPSSSSSPNRLARGA